MANVKIDKSTQYFMLAGMFVLLLFMGYDAFKATPVPVVNVDSDEIARLVSGAIIIPTDNVSDTSDKLDAIYNEVLRGEKTEGVAERLALDELETRDFKKDLVSFLMSEEETLQDMDYKDIEDISIRDVDVEVEGDSAEVSVEFKVYVSNFGDEDEQEMARVSVTFYIEDLDEEENFEDAEVVETSKFDLIKFYD